MKKCFLLVFLLICMAINAQQKLPIIKLSGDFGYEYQDGIVSIIYPDGSSQDSLTARIKWRGGTTNADDKHKRNYKIKFTDDHRFFGLRNDDSWILDAGQADVYRLRNLIATELWNDFATKPYYIDKEPEALSGINSSLMNIVPETYNNKEPMMDVFEAKYPDLEDLDSTDYHTLWNAINFVVNSSDIEFENHIHDYFDIPVVIDYYLFVVLLNAIDNEGKNMYWAVYDQTKNKMITPAVWDLDISMGARSAEKYNKDYSSPEYDTGDVIYLITRLKQLNVDHFNDKVFSRYDELRKTVFSEDSLQKRYQYYYNLLKATGAAEREKEKWSMDSDIDGAIIDFDSEIAYIKNWITHRIKYLDEQKFYYHNSLINTYIEQKNSEGAIYNLQGQKMPKNQKLPKGIYIYKNLSTTIKYVGDSW